jgi:hypothetical protein
VVVVILLGLTCFMQGIKFSRVGNGEINNSQPCNVESCNFYNMRFNLVQT